MRGLYVRSSTDIPFMRPPPLSLPLAAQEVLSRVQQVLGPHCEAGLVRVHPQVCRVSVCVCTCGCVYACVGVDLCVCGCGLTLCTMHPKLTHEKCKQTHTSCLEAESDATSID